MRVRLMQWRHHRRANTVALPPSRQHLGRAAVFRSEPREADMDLIHQLTMLRLVEDRLDEHLRHRPTPYFVAGDRDGHPRRVRRGVGRILVGAGQRLLRAEGTAR